MRPLLAIAIPTYDDYRGLSMTIQSLGFHHNDPTPITVMDNYGKCEATKNFCAANKLHYVVDTTVQGTAYAKDRAIRESNAHFVLVMDDHVMLRAEGLDSLRKYLSKLPVDCKDLFHGCLVNARNEITATELRPTWGKSMWGQWFDRSEGGRVALPEDGFEVWGHGGGLFCTGRIGWPGFHPRCRGFGGEEGALQEQVRTRGGKVVTLPFLRWTHSFNDVAGVKHVIKAEDKLRNYLLNLIGTNKAVQSWQTCMLHFMNTMSLDRIKEIAAECLPKDLEIKVSVELSSMEPVKR